MSIKNIMNKIASTQEVELKSEVIELGLIDDLKKEYGKLQKIESVVAKRASDLRSEKARLQGDVAELFDISKSLESFIKKATDAAKELGVDVPKEVSAVENLKNMASTKAKDILKEFNL